LFFMNVSILLGIIRTEFLETFAYHTSVVPLYFVLFEIARSATRWSDPLWADLGCLCNDRSLVGPNSYEFFVNANQAS
jgi:hypothetical protein